MLGNVDGTVERAVGVVVGALVVLEIEEVQIDVELACVHQLDERRVELAVHRGAAGAQRFHVDGYGGSPLGFLAIPFVGDYEAGLVVGVSRLGTDFLELAIGLVHGHVALLATAAGVGRPHSLVYGESSDGHQHHNNGHHNAADDGLLLTLLGCLLGPCLLCGLLGRSALSACGTLGLTLRI